MVNNSSEFQVNTFNSLREYDSHTKLNQSSRTCTRSSEDNTQTIFLQKVKLILSCNSILKFKLVCPKWSINFLFLSPNIRVPQLYIFYFFINNHLLKLGKIQYFLNLEQLCLFKSHVLCLESFQECKNVITLVYQNNF